MEACKVRGLVGCGGTLLLLAGCVYVETYEELRNEFENTKLELKQTHKRYETLPNQLAAAGDTIVELQKKLEKALSENLSLREAHVKEQSSSEVEIQNLKLLLRELKGQNKRVAQELAVIKKRNATRLEVIRELEKELKEHEPAPVLPPPSSAKPPVSALFPSSAQNPRSPEAEAPKASMPSPAGSGSAPSPSPKPFSSVKSIPNLVNINEASLVDLTMNLGLVKEDSDKITKNRPYKTEEDLVRKAGLSKATVDKIKDKITFGRIIAP